MKAINFISTQKKNFESVNEREREREELTASGHRRFRASFGTQ